MLRLSVVLAVVGCCSAAWADDRLNGNWARGDGAARVRIAPCGSSICAVNTWVRDASNGEKVGDRLVMSLNTKSPTVLSGAAHDPQRSLTYSLEIQLGATTMKTTGCVFAGLLCKTVAWAKSN